ncbi:hypothetical protein [Insolitispirillum peregrinum]|uniref:hypothetical protein n=1 Tax=Insolitispirillum peregrinum TaxID=80876 RepID=UPI003609CE2D
MSITLTLNGPTTEAARAEAAALLQALTGETPQEQTISPTSDGRRDAALVVAVASLVLAVPGGILATLQLADRVRKRRELTPKVTVLKTVLEKQSIDGTIRIEQTEIRLNDLEVDQILDRLL